MILPAVAMWATPGTPLSAQRASGDSVRALLAVGRYDAAEQLARRGAAAGDASLLTPLGDALMARGRRAAAESAYVRAAGSTAPDSLTAAVRLAVLHYDRGDRERAMPEFDRFITIYNDRAARLSSAELAAVALACRYLGADNPQLFKDALRAYDRAIAADPTNVEARAALGDLFLEKYNGADAQTTFAAALEVDADFAPALLGAARRLMFDGAPGADSLIARALTINPNYVDARVVRARQLVDIERYPDAQREIDQALAVNPASVEALAVAAAIRFVLNDQKGFDELKTRATALSPRDARFFTVMSDVAGHVRLYSVAADFARQGLAADPKSAKAHGMLGMNLLRLGDIAGGNQQLDTAFAGDPFDVWIKNTLDLLDTFKNYTITTTPHATFMIENDESALLSVYLHDLAERAYATFAARYAFTPPPPVRIEVYRSHADFSVRTVGLSGLGALGVSFGSTLAFDSPAAKDAGPFNWGSTVWHELAHTFTLGLTDHRVPRWLSEGLSVWEEHQASPYWGFKPSEGFVEAMRAGKLVPVSRMNDGFMRPAYPEQVQFSYLQASIVCDLIVRDGGVKALVAMLNEYKAGRTTDEVFQKVLGTDLKAFDRKFDLYLRDRMFSEAPVDADSLRAAAKAMITAGRNAEAAALLERVARIDEAGYEPLVELSRLYAVMGDTAKSAAALEAAIWVNPFDIEVHQRLALLYQTVGQQSKRVRERRAVVALNPVDRAEAFYQLALAEHAGGDAGAAKRDVLQALEEAPNFARAQELLLTIVDGAKP
jgi:tetratricopeptide (TPR) repeat protein